MPFYNRQVNPMLQALIANAAAGPQRQPVAGGMGPPQALNMPVGGGQMQPIRGPQGLLDQVGTGVGSTTGNMMNPMMMAMMLNRFKGMGGGTGVDPSQIGIGNMVNKWAGAIPTPDFSKFELPPNFNWF